MKFHVPIKKTKCLLKWKSFYQIQKTNWTLFAWWGCENIKGCGWNFTKHIFRSLWERFLWSKQKKGYEQHEPRDNLTCLQIISIFIRLVYYWDVIGNRGKREEKEFLRKGSNFDTFITEFSVWVRCYGAVNQQCSNGHQVSQIIIKLQDGWDLGYFFFGNLKKMSYDCFGLKLTFLFTLKSCMECKRFSYYSWNKYSFIKLEKGKILFFRGNLIHLERFLILQRNRRLGIWHFEVLLG